MERAEDFAERIFEACLEGIHADAAPMIPLIRARDLALLDEVEKMILEPRVLEGSADDQREADAYMVSLLRKALAK